jgi:tetratricopeptide (TPR) repeat protein
VLFRSTENVEAYNLYLKARYHIFKGTVESMAKSKEHLEQAIAVDPNYALAWSGLAEFDFLLGYFGVMPQKVANARSSHAIKKALEFDEMLPQAHGMMAVLRANDFDWKGAEREFHRALELGPKSEEVWINYDYYYLVPMRRLDEAVAASRRAVELDPLSPFLQWRLAYRYYLTRQWDLAVAQCRNALELDPHHPAATFHLGLAYSQSGRVQEAIRVFETLLPIAPAANPCVGVIGYIYAQAGRTVEVRKLLAGMQSLAQKANVPPSSFAWIYFGLGETDRGFEWLEKAIDERDTWMLHIQADPLFDPLRSYPCYPALLRKMNLEP